MMQIAIRIQEMEFSAELDDNPTTEAISKALPLEGHANVWGEEIYFDIPLVIPLAEDAVEEVEVGTLAYWPTGNAFCIFFGSTPVSSGSKPRAYSPVNVFGRIKGDPSGLKRVAEGTLVSITAASI